MEAESLSERLLSTYHTQQYYNPEYQKANLQNCEELKFHMHLLTIRPGKPRYLHTQNKIKSYLIIRVRESN